MVDTRAIQKVRVFVASPGDVLDERRRLIQVVEQLNRGVADRMGLTVDLLRWETHVASDLGRPQGVVFDQLPPEEWDIFVGILWLRFGSDTGEIDPDTGQPYRSGTEEEFKTAYRWRAESNTNWPKMMIYRCTRNPESNLYFAEPENAAQFARVAEFFENCKPDGKHPMLVMEYSQPEEFERSVRDHLEKWLWQFAEINWLLESTSASHRRTLSAPLHDSEIKEIVEQLSQLAAELQSNRSHLTNLEPAILEKWAEIRTKWWLSPELLDLDLSDLRNVYELLAGYKALPRYPDCRDQLEAYLRDNNVLSHVDRCLRQIKNKVARLRAKII